MKTVTQSLLLIACIFQPTSNLLGQTYTFTGPDRGLWSDGSNWSGGIVPNSSTTFAVVDSLYQSGPGPNVGSVVYDLSNGQLQTLWVGDAGIAYLNSGAGTQLNVTSIELAHNQSSTGTIGLTGGGTVWNASWFVNVGNFGTGFFEISEMAHLNSPRINLGAGSTAYGEMLVTGAGSFVTATDFHIGDAGEGELVITNGGHVNATNVTRIGFETNSNGRVFVDGPNSNLNSQNGLFVGENGVGNLVARNGASVSCNYLRVGRSAGPETPSRVTIDGNDSELISGDQFHVGVFGNGELAITNNGKLDSKTAGAYIGLYGNSDGKIFVLNGGTWESGYALAGSNGKGLISVIDGSITANGFQDLIAVGTGIGTQGEGKIFVKNGTIESDGYHVVGNSGKGTLSIFEKSIVTNRAGYVGLQKNSTGSVLIQGSSTARTAVWNNNEFLILGENPVGDDGGHGSIQFGGVSTITVGNLDHTDYASFQNNILSGRKKLLVGNTDDGSGFGRLVIRNGSNVSRPSQTYIGLIENSIGNARVIGQGSRLFTHSIGVGGYGNGTLDIEDQGYVSADYVSIGSFTGGTGTVNISGIENPSNRLTGMRGAEQVKIGRLGTGIVNVDGTTGFARISSGSKLVVGSEGGTGSIHLNGEYASSGAPSIIVGDNGTGEITLNNRSSIGSRFLSVGQGSSGIGTINMIGPSNFGRPTQINHTTINVGDEGKGLIHANGDEFASVKIYNNLGAYYGRTCNTNIGINGGEGAVQLSGRGVTWLTTDSIFVGKSGVGEFSLESGSKVRNRDTFIGYEASANGTVNIGPNLGFGSVTPSWASRGSFYVGGDQMGAQGLGTLNTSGSLTVDNDLVVWSTGEISIHGGSVRADRVFLEPGSNFTMTGGYLITESLQTNFVSLDGGVLYANEIVDYSSDGPLLVVQDGGRLGASTTIHGDYQIDSGLVLTRMAGLTPVVEHDQINVMGDLALNNAELKIAMVWSYQAKTNNAYEIISVGGNLVGEFVGLSEGSNVGSYILGNYEGADLFITYQGGDGNDIWLYTNAIPEPNTAALLCFLMGTGLIRRKR